MNLQKKRLIEALNYQPINDNHSETKPFKQKL